MIKGMEKAINELKVLLLAGLVVLFTQFINLKGEMDIAKSLIGMVMIIVIAMASLAIKSLIPLKIPAFAWASLLALLITTPWSPMAEFFINSTKQITAGQIGTVILAVAGVSIGTKLGDIKKLSWKIILVAFVVFIGTFLGSAVIAQIVLKMRGLI